MEISDEVVEVACYVIYPDWQYLLEYSRKKHRELVRSALQAAIPLVVEGLVPAHYVIGLAVSTTEGYRREGYNQCIEDILAKVKK